MSTAGQILTEAAGIVDGDRQAQHGEKERSFTAIAHLWTAYLECRQYPVGRIRPHDVAQMMALLKMERAEWGSCTIDHWIDMAGYAGIAGELAEKD